jgi:nucleotide-binding universal stress UspA family protein
MRHMFVASDLTGRSMYPLQRAMQLKEQCGALVTVLHVVEPGLTSKLEERRCADATAVLQKWRAAFPEAKRQDVAVNVMVGDPFATIVEEAASCRRRHLQSPCSWPQKQSS